MPSITRERQRRALKWTDPQIQALNLIFEGRLTREKIAANCSVPLRTLDDWIAHPDFQAKLTERRENLIASLDHKPYIRKERRLIALADMAESAREQYEARPWLKEERQIGRDPESGEPLMLTNESFNRDAHAAFRGALDDIAKELGERTNRSDASAQMTVIAIASDVLDAI